MLGNFLVLQTKTKKQNYETGTVILMLSLSSSINK